MGGFCVQVSFDGRRIADDDVLAMASAAPHRGPDGTRTWSAPGAAMAHQRLLLLPEDAWDLQPLQRDGLVLVADARIDNRDELAPVLCRHGYLPDAGEVPDSEVVLAAYRLWGRGCAARLIGDFAFAIWDERRRAVFAARDPMGMRPLYYRWEARRRLLLATEVKQVLAAEGVPREVHEAALAATLAGPHMPASWTVFSGVDQLPAGQVLEADAESCRTGTGWQPDPSVRFREDQRSVEDAFREVLGEAVRARLRSSRPVGIWLSGGLDSGSVASLAGALREQGRVPTALPLSTYSWSFEDLIDSDERAVSDHIVRRYSLRATSVPADDGWPLAGYPEHGPDEDDCFVWPYQALMERTIDRCRADGMGVLLAGDRGDEVTGDWVFDELGMLAAGHPVSALADLRHAGHSPWSGIRGGLLVPLLRAGLPSVVARRDAPRDGRRWPAWVPDDFARRTDLGDLVEAGRRASTFGGPARSARHQRIFSAQAVRTAVLRQRTRARRGMGFADPYSDRRVVELVLSLPQWRVQRRSDPKSLARSAMHGVMPEEARRAARKTIPYSLFERGFRERAVPVVQDLLTGTRAGARGWLDEAAAQQAYEHFVRTGDARDDFWWPLTVEMWLRRWWD